MLASISDKQTPDSSSEWCHDTYELTFLVNCRTREEGKEWIGLPKDDKTEQIELLEEDPPIREAGSEQEDVEETEEV